MTVRAFSRGTEVYLVPREGGRELVVGATVEERGFDGRPTAGGVYELLRDARTVLPMTAEYALAETSVGWRPGTPDNAPILGRCELEGLVLATGHYRNGVLLTPITADVIADLITTGRSPRSATPFTLDRFSPVAVEDPMIIPVNGELRDATGAGPAVRRPRPAAGCRRRAGSRLPSTERWCPRSQHRDHRAGRGRRVEIVTAVQGG